MFSIEFFWRGFSVLIPASMIWYCIYDLNSSRSQSGWFWYFWWYFLLELKERHTLKNYALAAGHILKGLEILFGSLLIWTRVSCTMATIHGQISESEWRSVCDGDDFNTSDSREGRAMYLALAIIIFFMATSFGVRTQELLWKTVHWQ